MGDQNPAGRETVSAAASPKVDLRPSDRPKIRLAELLGALSYALDMTEGQPAGHCVRCCWIGVNIGRQLGLPDADQTTLYYTLLLKDLGCSSNAARICQLYLTDDIEFKHDFKTIGDGLPQVLRFVLSHTGLQTGLAERFMAMVNIVQNGGQIAKELIETRCQRGAQIARRLRFSEAVADGIRDLDEHWDGNGKPSNLRGEDISIFARIALLAQVIDVFQTGGGREQALQETLHRSGTWFDPALVASFERVATRPDFWETLRSDRIEEAVYALDPGRRVELVDDDYFDDIAFAFAKIIDAKSPYTHGHSERVALFTDLITGELGMSPDQRRWMRRAALLHDIGKLGVSNQILDKPDKLDSREWAAMQRHAELSETILERIGPFRDMARVVGAHHERLDGNGYPRRLRGDEIRFETRIITTADVFDALTADRPYRGPIPISKAFDIMAESVGPAIDPICFAALKGAMAR
ncbi:MAG: HD domain-containing protein [Rhizobiales bacterium]|nr:HD domain-containing protein [Hyphomicrobiales bacterium]